MGYRQYRTVKALQIMLQYGQRFNIQIIGRLVQQQDIRCAHQHTEQIQSAPFTTGQAADAGPLGFTGKQKGFQHLCRRQGTIRCAYGFRNITDKGNDLLIFIHMPAVLGKVTDFYRFAEGNYAGILLCLSCQNAQEGRFTGAIASYNANAVIPGDGQVKITNIRHTVPALGQSLYLNGLFAQPGRYRLHFHRAVSLRCRLCR